MDWLTFLSSLAASLLIAFVAGRWAAVLQREKVRDELKLEYSVETAIIHLLKNPSYKIRSFAKIKHRLRGFEDDELRKALVRAGAVRNKDDDEMWGLLRLNEDAVK